MEQSTPEYTTIQGRRFSTPEFDSPTEAQRDITEAFSFFDDWESRYQYLIDLGRSVAVMDEDLKIPSNKVSGCQSQVWFYQDTQIGKLYFQAASDSVLVSGLIALLLKVYSGRTAQEILATKPDFVEQIGLARFLSPTRRNGLVAMLENLKKRARCALDGADQSTTRQ